MQHDNRSRVYLQLLPSISVRGLRSDIFRSDPPHDRKGRSAAPFAPERHASLVLRPPSGREPWHNTNDAAVLSIHTLADPRGPGLDERAVQPGVGVSSKRDFPRLCPLGTDPGLGPRSGWACTAGRRSCHAGGCSVEHQRTTPINTAFLAQLNSRSSEGMQVGLHNRKDLTHAT